MEKNETKLTTVTFDEVCDLGRRVAETGMMDYDMTDDLHRLAACPLLSDSDKCVLGLALTFWSWRRKTYIDRPHAYDFTPHDFYASAINAGEVLGFFDGPCGFTSTASFAQTLPEAVFVVVNSMSRGFNLESPARFGGDRHLQFLAALFAKEVLRTYFDIFVKEKESGFRLYQTMMDAKVVDAHERYAQFLTWMRRRIKMANNVVDAAVSPATDVGLASRVLCTVKLTRRHHEIATTAKGNIFEKILNEHDATADNCDVSPDRKCKCGKPDTCEECGKSNKVEENDGMMDGTVVQIEINGRKVSLYRKYGESAYKVVGDLKDGDIELLKDVGFLPRDYELDGGRGMLRPINECLISD